MASLIPKLPIINRLVPYSDSDDSSEEEAEIEEETCVGKRAYKKQKPLPKRLTKIKKRNNSVQANPCQNKKCGNLCSEKFTESDRREINEHFWGFGNKIRQRSWLLSCIKRKSINRRRSGDGKKRQHSYEYTIAYNNNCVKVCQQFLLKTLHISQKMLVNIRNGTKILNASSTKCRFRPHNKSDEEKVNILKSFIEHLPAVPSHYCRNKSIKMYLPEEFRNVKVLYQYYKEHLKNTDKVSAELSLAVFRNIFKNTFHIGFHTPKKDKCVTCENFKNLDVEEQNSLSQTKEYQNHVRDKEKSKEIFLKEQKQSKTNSSFLCASFDLQKVLNTPHGKSVTLFYSRKYAYYNESIYENGTRNGYCFLWGESDGKRGCNEICTIIFQYLKLLDKRKKHSSISLYCDSCPGQNRNKAILATINFFLENATFIKDIKITYLLPGHTMMPVDSIHSTIESFIRKRTVWAPSEWYTMISNARRNPEGYKCIILNYFDFKDWKTFSEAKVAGSKKISFKNLRSAFFEKNCANIKLKYGYLDESEIIEWCINSNTRSSRNSKKIIKEPLPLYNDFLKISVRKYKDLKALCDKNTIPKQYHNEFLNLKYDNNVNDTLPETDQEDVI